VNKLRENFQTIIAFAAVVGLIVSSMAYFAKASELDALREEVVLTQVRLDQKIVSDQAYETQKQIWALEEKNTKYGADCTRWPDERDRKQYKELRAQHDELVEQKKAMIKKK
jgi:hypothetical protein